MKRTLDQVKAFELAKPDVPDLQLIIAGGVSDAYGRHVLDYIAASRYAADITYLGRVSHARKRELMQKSHALLSDLRKVPGPIHAAWYDDYEHSHLQIQAVLAGS